MKCKVYTCAFPCKRKIFIDNLQSEIGKSNDVKQVLNLGESHVATVMHKYDHLLEAKEEEDKRLVEETSARLSSASVSSSRPLTTSSLASSKWTYFCIAVVT